MVQNVNFQHPLSQAEPSLASAAADILLMLSNTAAFLARRAVRSLMLMVTGCLNIDGSSEKRGRDERGCG
jgi:hypothetical protein